MNDIDFDKLFEGISPDLARDFLLEQVNEQTLEKFVAGRRGNKLRRQYDEEMAGLKLSHLDAGARARKISQVKAKYRAQGLEVW